MKTYVLWWGAVARMACTHSFRVLILAALTLAPAPSLAAEPGSKHEVFDIPAKAPGLSLHLEHRAPPARQHCTKHAVLLVHGNFFPASTAYGVDLPGGSALERLADACVSAYTLDFRGYGGSTRPAFMSEPIGPYVAFATAAQAQEDVASALAFIRKREQLQRVSLRTRWVDAPHRSRHADSHRADWLAAIAAMLGPHT